MYIHTRTRNFGKICTTLPHYPGYGYSIFILRPPKLVRMRVRVRIRVHVTGGVLGRSLTYVGRLSEQPHWRWPKQVQRWPNKVDLRPEWPLQGIPSEKVASGRCSPISTNDVALFGLSCTRFYPAPCFGHIPARCTLFWPLSSKVHLVLATAQNKILNPSSENIREKQYIFLTWR